MKTEKEGRSHVISGTSRCGKSTLVAQQMRTSRRCVAWDPEDQWSKQKGFRKITSRRELLAAIKTPGHMKLAYVPGGALKPEFDFVCKCVFYAGRYIAPLDFVAEELADVSTPGKASENWGILVRRGLKRGINIYAISQRWAEADKTIFGNASEYQLFRQSSMDDVRYMARKTNVPEEEIWNLEAYQYIIYDPLTREKTKGKTRKSL